VSERTVRGPVRDAVRRWSLATIAGSLLATLAVLVLDAGWSGGPPDSFLAGVGIVLLVEFGILWRLLSPIDPTTGARPITLASWVTIGRGVPVALLAGFLFVPSVTGTIAWIPAALFAAATLFDAVDGSIARASDSVSELGGRLDDEIDSLAILVGTIVSVVHGLAPAIFLAVGLAHYAFVFGLLVRRWLDRPTTTLEPSQFRRIVGAATMLTIWLVLLPGLGGRYLVGGLLVPFSISFARDWLVACRALDE